jgi:hypothetical protein
MAPWLEFANLWPEVEKRRPDSVGRILEFALQPRDVPGFPSGSLSIFAASLPEGAAFLCRLAGQLVKVLSLYAGEGKDPQSADIEMVGAAMVVSSLGKIIMVRHEPFSDFLNLIERVPISRIGRCPVCERFFYRLRTDRKACSKLCNGTLRGRRWRQNEDERISSAASMLRDGKAVKEIARALETTTDRVRRYLRKARDREQKGI